MNVEIAMAVALRFAITRTELSRVLVELVFGWRMTGGHVKVQYLFSKVYSCIIGGVASPRLMKSTQCMHSMYR